MSAARRRHPGTPPSLRRAPGNGACPAPIRGPRPLGVRLPPPPASILRRVARLRCLLCGASDPVLVAAWHPTPEAARELMLPSEPGYRIVYRLCAACSARDDMPGAAEERILADVAAMAGRPEMN